MHIVSKDLSAVFCAQTTMKPGENSKRKTLHLQEDGHLLSLDCFQTMVLHDCLVQTHLSSPAFSKQQTANE